MGMGGVQTSNASGPESIFWNPSLISTLPGNYELSLMHIELYGGVANHDFIGFTAGLDSISNIGLAIIRLGIDNIPDTRFLYDASGIIDYNNIQFFSAVDYAGIISYKREMTKWNGLTFGANFKIVHRKAGSFAKAWGFGLDLGVNYEIGKWKLGAMGRDITGTFNAWSHSADLVEDVFQSTGNTLPSNSVELTVPKFFVGGSRMVLQRENWNLLFATDLLLSLDGRRNTLIPTRVFSVDPSLGLEFSLKEKIFIRSGASTFQRTEQGGTVTPHFGLGLLLEKFRVDYAITRLDGLNSGLFSHTFSLNILLEDER